MQTKVSADRIDTFLNEPEVAEQVSILESREVRSNGPSLSANGTEGSGVDVGIDATTLEDVARERSGEVAPLGIINGNFRWNAIEDTETQESKDKKKKDKAKKDKKKDKKKGRDDAQEEDGTSVEGDGSEPQEAVRFELRDIDVVFPQGQLTLVTGPTASGKTALVVSNSLNLVI